MPEKQTYPDQHESVPSGSVWQNIQSHIREVWLQVKEEIFPYAATHETIHPAFTMTDRVNKDLTWFYNRSWSGPRPPFKVTFFFNDPAELDGCDWVCKIGNNIDSDVQVYKYYGVMYGDPAKSKTDFDLQAMSAWAKKFHQPRIYKYDGEFVQEL